MKKFIGLFIIVSFILYSGIIYSYEMCIPKIEVSISQQIEKYSVSIISSEIGIGTCSGTIIKENEYTTHVLTAKHCINVSNEMSVENNKVLYILTSVDDDLALLIVDGLIPNKTSAKIATKDIELGDYVYHIGYPKWKKYFASGKYLRYNSDWRFLGFKSIGGCSGGGIFNRQAELVGVLWGGFNNQPIAIMESLNDINKFLEPLL